MAKNYRPIPVPVGVQIDIVPGFVTVKGKLGNLVIKTMAGLTVKKEDGKIDVEAGPGVARAHVGTLRSHLRNAIAGVTKGFEKALQVRGMGYRVQKTKEGIQIQCGFSHPVSFPMPKEVAFEVGRMPNPDDTKQQMFEITIRGTDRQVVGQVAARIRAIKPVDLYKGKGIRYRNEFVRKKAGKRAVGTEV
ncbi:50S ribosomal protein L6 [candidate division WOR-3 bacterium JGI_Cruoil_03_51_56]|uniref:50S ribosomal protein L6 n=1 Tax=candidate division WOR-3 bacterium JGI_Cruoil_03_51_56 TaxID=1973747 RepID=A0A235BVF7_UNCW3|nr:MAG: 50S ribosomal protein L6 [candidate division WOR-3 bacterium JGI_Cruoil_03_51_56]